MYIYIYVYIYIQNEETENFSETSSFRSKSSWKPPQENASLELFLSEIEWELFEIPNFSKGEWECMRSLANLMIWLVNDRSIVIRKADKGSRVVVWDPEHYIVESEKHLSDKHVFRDVGFKSKSCKNLSKQVMTSLKIWKEKGN